MAIQYHLRAAARLGHWGLETSEEQGVSSRDSEGARASQSGPTTAAEDCQPLPESEYFPIHLSCPEMDSFLVTLLGVQMALLTVRKLEDLSAVQ